MNAPSQQDKAARFQELHRTGTFFMAGVPGKSFTVAALAQAGVRRISFGSALYEVAIKAVTGAAGTALRDGRFGWLAEG